MSVDHLVELEQRVTEKFAAKAGERMPETDFGFDIESWGVGVDAWELDIPLDPNIPQFPREQWLSYPAQRTVALILCDRMLDLELDEAQWAQLCFLMQFGGKVRVV